MNRWLCFFYNGNENQACILLFSTMGATPATHEEDVRDAIQAAGLSIEMPAINGCVDISDINDALELSVLVDGYGVKTPLVEVH